MKISEIKTYYEILEFIETTCDEAQEAIEGINTFKAYLASEEQEEIIEKWVLDWWKENKDIYEDEEEVVTFGRLPLFTRFSYKNTYMCKVPCTSGPLARAMGMDYIGNIHQISPNEVVDKD